MSIVEKEVSFIIRNNKERKRRNVLIQLENIELGSRTLSTIAAIPFSKLQG